MTGRWRLLRPRSRGIAAARRSQAALGLLLALLPGAPHAQGLSKETAPAARSGSVTVRVGEHPGFERIVLQAPGASRLPASVGGGRVRIDGVPALDPHDVARLHGLDRIDDVATAAGKLVLVPAPRTVPKLLRLHPDRLVLDLFAGTLQAAGGGGTGGRSERGPGPITGAGRVEPQRPPPEAGTAGPTPMQRPAGGHGARGAAAAGGPEGERRAAAASVTPAPAPSDGERSSDATGPEQVAQGDASARAVAILAAPPPATRSILFDWPMPVGAAAYLRSGRAWIVFDAGPGSFLPDRNSLASLAPRGLRRIRTYRRADASLVELVFDGTPALRMRREGTAWIVELGAASEEGETLRFVGPPTELRLPGGRRVLTLRDPIVGDTVAVATSPEPLAGAVQGRRLVDLEVLPSPQGLAWLPRADDVRATIVDGELVVGRPAGLRVADGLSVPSGASRVASHRPTADTDTGSPEGGRNRTADEREGVADTPLPGPSDPAGSQAPTPARAAAGGPSSRLPSDAGVAGRRIADAGGPPGPDEPRREPDASAAPADGLAPPTWLPPWKTALGLAELGDSDVVARRDARRDIRLALGEARGPSAARLALELARLYLAEAFAEEALTSLRLAPESVSTDPDLAAKRALIAGAALALRGDGESARRLLAAPEFAGEPEAALWLAWLDAGQGNWEEAAAALEANADLFEAYPQPLRLPFRLRSLSVALQTGDADRAYVWLDRLLAAPAPPRYRNRIRFLEAMTLARDGAYDEAQRILSDLARSAPWTTAAESAYAAIDLAREAGRLDEPETLAALEAKRHLWRGHPWEPRVLRTLGELQARLGRPHAALVSWRDALDRYPDNPALDGLGESMRALYGATFDPRLPPHPTALEALRIYREFSELRPLDAEGRKMTEWLARFLAREGLPRTAFELAGADLPAPAEDSATRRLLAELSLAADRPDRTLDLLSDVEDGDATRLLRARALLALGRAREALSAAIALQGPGAERLLADAAWAAGRDELLVGLTDRLLQLAAREEEPMDTIRAGRALLALARRAPPEARDRLDLLAALAGPAVAAAVEALLPGPAPTGTPAAVAAAARDWVGRSRDVLARLQADPLRAAAMDRGSAGL